MRRYAAKVGCECANCGAAFHRKPSEIAKGGGKFCSIDCRMAFKAPSVFVGRCEGCGTKIGRDAKGRARRFCSRECVGKFVGRNGAARIRNPPKEVVCKRCGGKFSTYHRSKVFCSNVCARKARIGSQGHGSKDKNHDEIVGIFKKLGAVIFDMSSLGGGAPDLLVGHKGEWIAVEIKNPLTAYGRSGLNANQKAFARQAATVGCVMHVVTNETEALALLGARRGV